MIPLPWAACWAFLPARVAMTTARPETLTPADRAKLAHILDRLGSDHDGERAAAGLLATKLVRDRGASWAWLLGLERPPAPPAGNWRARATWCAARPELMTPWENALLASMSVRPTPPTPKQTAIIDRLVARRMAAGGDQ